MKTRLERIGELKLLPYQSAFAANRSRFKIGLWARQTGKDHTATAEAVVDCYCHPGTTWIILAASERQALESLAKAKEWAGSLRFEIADYTEAAGNLPYAVARTASTEIKWSNGSRLIALPANPSTIRGYSANLILTEFAFHENPDAIWRAIYPAISNPLRGGVKKLRIISTPNGLNNRFAQLWHSNYESDAPIFHTSRITIHDAIGAGLPIDAAELQAGLNDPEAWAQEYLCQFMDNSTVLLPYDLIESCESPLATELSSLDSLSTSAIPNNGQRPQLFAGIDFARKNHLTVCWIFERIETTRLGAGLGLRLGEKHPALNHNFHPSPRSAASSIPNLQFSIFNSQSNPSPIQNAQCSINNAQWNPSPNNQSSIINHQFCYLTREVLTLRNTSTPDQLAVLLPRLRLCQRVSLDYTGPGIGLGDFLHRELGFRVELCPFTAPFKAELFPRLAAAFESRELLIPIARDIREDLHSIYRTTTNSGNILYRAHSTPDGHADRTTALALALRAAQSAPILQAATAVGQKFRIAARNSSYTPARTLAILS